MAALLAWSRIARRVLPPTGAAVACQAIMPIGERANPLLLQASIAGQRTMSASAVAAIAHRQAAALIAPRTVAAAPALAAVHFRPGILQVHPLGVCWLRRPRFKQTRRRSTRYSKHGVSTCWPVEERLMDLDTATTMEMPVQTWTTLCTYAAAAVAVALAVALPPIVPTRAIMRATARAMTEAPEPSTMTACSTAIVLTVERGASTHARTRPMGAAMMVGQGRSGRIARSTPIAQTAVSVGRRQWRTATHRTAIHHTAIHRTAIHRRHHPARPSHHHHYRHVQPLHAIARRLGGGTATRTAERTTHPNLAARPQRAIALRPAGVWSPLLLRATIST